MEEKLYEGFRSIVEPVYGGKPDGELLDALILLIAEDFPEGLIGKVFNDAFDYDYFEILARYPFARCTKGYMEVVCGSLFENGYVQWVIESLGSCGSESMNFESWYGVG